MFNGLLATALILVGSYSTPISSTNQVNYDSVLTDKHHTYKIGQWTYYYYQERYLDLYYTLDFTNGDLVDNRISYDVTFNLYISENETDTLLYTYSANTLDKGLFNFKEIFINSNAYYFPFALNSYPNFGDRLMLTPGRNVNKLTLVYDTAHNGSHTMLYSGIYTLSQNKSFAQNEATNYYYYTHVRGVMGEVLESILYDFIVGIDNEIDLLDNKYDSLVLENDQLNSKLALTTPFEWFGSVFNAMGNVLNIELLPNIKLAYIFAIPIIIGALFFIIKALVQ